MENEERGFQRGVGVKNEKEGFPGGAMITGLRRFHMPWTN